MKILISGICGFAGSTLAARLKESLEGAEIFGFDNFSRPGSELNRASLNKSGIRVWAADARLASDISQLPQADWVIDCAANPSVLAGLGAPDASRQLVENNLLGTVNLLEYCKQRRARFILLSTSRVYSLELLAGLPVKRAGKRFDLGPVRGLPAGVSHVGISEKFPTTAPLSLYGSTKLASECLALEYGSAFDFPVWINRCGVFAGAGQFGRADNGIFSYWIHSWVHRRPLKYIGFGGKGHQVRDCMHPNDLVPLLLRQMRAGAKRDLPRIVNIGGGVKNSMSLAQLSDWCAERFGAGRVHADTRPRPFDVPWLVMDSALAAKTWNWRVETVIENILDEIARHAMDHPDWLDISAP